MNPTTCELDIRTDATYNIKINRNRTLNQVFEAYFLSGDTEYTFDFSIYTGATMEVRKQFGSTFTALTFSTDDGSLILGTDGKFSLIKSAGELQKVRAGEYKYDFYLSNTSLPKRAFLSGDFIHYNYITN